jgi:hypothetical protein
MRGYGGRGAGKTLTFQRERERAERELRIGPPVQVRNVIYTGAIWGGVQIRDVAMADIADIAAASLDNYQGLYSDLVDLELSLVEDI